MKKKYLENEETSGDWKINNLKVLKSRLSDWQLKAFEESYQLRLKMVSH